MHHTHTHTQYSHTYLDSKAIFIFITFIWQPLTELKLELRDDFSEELGANSVTTTPSGTMSSCGAFLAYNRPLAAAAARRLSNTVLAPPSCFGDSAASDFGTCTAGLYNVTGDR
jgi:hypothetical protein